MTEKTTIDLRVYKGIGMSPQSIEEIASELIKEIKELKEVIQKRFAS